MITLAKRLLRYKFIRFLITGIINTAFSYCCFIAFMFFIKIKEIDRGSGGSLQGLLRQSGCGEPAAGGRRICDTDSRGI